MASGCQIRLQLWAINDALPVGNVEVAVHRDFSGMAEESPIPGAHCSFYLPHHTSQTAGELEPSLPLPWIPILPQDNPRVSITVAMTMEMRLRSREQYTRVSEIYFRINRSPFTLSFSLLHLAGCSRIRGLAHARYTLLPKY